MIRILVVEDSPTQAFFIKTKLVDEGYEIQVANNGREALDLVPTFAPHLILTDLEMPVMDGLELVALSTEKYPTIPIILITAEGSDQSAIQSLQRGAAAYLPKSSLDENLFGTIDEVLDLMEANHSYAELIQSMVYNEFRFTLENKLELIRPLVELVQQMVSGIALCDKTGSVRIGMAVDHALRNAMCHGNLELSAADLEADSEFVVSGVKTLIERRRAESPYCDRRLHVTVEITPEHVRIVIKDDGPGFDSAAALALNADEIIDPEKGRGLVLIQALMDVVTFNESGNELTMLKRRGTAKCEVA